MPLYKLFIDGQWVKASSGKTFESLNPATGKSLGLFETADLNDVERAVQAAKRAFSKWKNTPAPHRGKLLLRFARLLEENKERLAKSLSEEMGKVLPEARGDI